MKVRIKTWEEMVDEFGYDEGDRTVIDIPSFHFTNSVEYWMPEDRIIDLDENNEWHCFLICPEMIAEYINEDNEHPYHRLQTREPIIEPPWWWTGKPVWCEVWDTVAYPPQKGWVIGYEGNDSNSEFRFTDEDGTWWKNAEPILLPETTAKVVITRNGETREVELTEEQIKELGI